MRDSASFRAGVIADSELRLWSLEFVIMAARHINTYSSDDPRRQELRGDERELKATGIAPRGCVGHLSVQAYLLNLLSSDLVSFLSATCHGESSAGVPPLRTRRGVACAAGPTALGRRARTFG